jgi:hypothetical protein
MQSAPFIRCAKVFKVATPSGSIQTQASWCKDDLNFSSRSSETHLQISSYFHYSCHLHDTTEYMASTMLPQRHTRIRAASTFSSKLRQTAEKSSAQKQYLTDHHRLGHVQQQRFKDINVDGIKKLGKRQLPYTSCPTCIASKSRKPNRPPATTPTDRAVDGPWQDVYSDMSGKFRIKSITGAKYFCVFVCRWSGAKQSKRTHTTQVRRMRVRQDG